MAALNRLSGDCNSHTKNVDRLILFLSLSLLDWCGSTDGGNGQTKPLNDAAFLWTFHLSH